MNDIEVLEDYIKLINKGYCDDCNELCNIYGTPVFPSRAIKQAIENLLKERQSDKERIKELEENNQQLEKWLNYYKLGNTVEEFEKIFGNTPINDIEEIKKYIFQNYIPKSLIKEKIEEYKAKRKKYYKKELSKAQHTKSMKMWGAIQVLEELLKGE